MFKNIEYFYTWLSGFVDGEGCFMIEHRIRVQKENKKYFSLIGKPSEFYPSFILGLRDDDRAILEEIKNQLGLGYVYSRRSYKKERPKAVLRISGKQCLKLIEIFDVFTPKSKKRRDYQIWRDFTLAKFMKTEDYSFLKNCFEGIKAVRKYTSEGSDCYIS